MARIQVLELPLLVEGDEARQRFAFVVDQVDETRHENFAGDVVVRMDSVDRDALVAFADEVGAVGVLIYSGEIEVA